MDKKISTFLNCLWLCIYAQGLPVVNSRRAITVEGCGTRSLSQKPQHLIVGGQNVPHGQHPWMISLQEDAGTGQDFKHICGAAVINENWIVTAAHCINYRSEPKKYQALAGLHSISKEDASTVQRIEISKLVVHEDFERIKGLKNDVALLKTAKPIDISGSKGYVNGICLPETDTDPTGKATVIGWGRTSEWGAKSDTLREVVVPIVRRDSCKESYRHILDTNICAGADDEDSCQTDSGGPLFQTSSKGVSTLIGIVSFGIGCGDKYYPGVYTKVSSYLKWMEKVMSEY